MHTACSVGAGPAPASKVRRRAAAKPGVRRVAAAPALGAAAAGVARRARRARVRAVAVVAAARRPVGARRAGRGRVPGRALVPAVAAQAAAVAALATAQARELVRAQAAAARPARRLGRAAPGGRPRRGRAARRRVRPRARRPRRRRRARVRGRLRRARVAPHVRAAGHQRDGGVQAVVLAPARAARVGASGRGAPMRPQRGAARAHFWLGRFTGLGAVTLPSDTMRRPGLRAGAHGSQHAVIQQMRGRRRLRPAPNTTRPALQGKPGAGGASRTPPPGRAADADDHTQVHTRQRTAQPSPAWRRGRSCRPRPGYALPAGRRVTAPPAQGLPARRRGAACRQKQGAAGAGQARLAPTGCMTEADAPEERPPSPAAASCSAAADLARHTSRPSHPPQRPAPFRRLL